MKDNFNLKGGKGKRSLRGRKSGRKMQHPSHARHGRKQSGQKFGHIRKTRQQDVRNEIDSIYGGKSDQVFTWTFQPDDGINVDFFLPLVEYAMNRRVLYTYFLF